MTSEQWINDFIDDIVMERGVSHDTARALLLSWLYEVMRWEKIMLKEMLEYLLND